MRWMKLEAHTSVPHFYFLLISRNKVKIVFFCLFPDLSVQYKNIPKIKVLRMPCQFNMIFSGIFEDLPCQNHHGGSCHLATRVEGAPYPPRTRPLPRGAPEAPPTYPLHPYIPTYPKTSKAEDRSGVPPPQASVATKNLSGARSGALPEGEPITGGHLHHPGAIHDEEGVVHPRG